MKNQASLWSWSCAVLLAASLLSLWVAPKFIGVDIHPIFGWAEALSGQTWLEPGGRYAFGILMGVLAVAVVIPRSRRLAAIAALATSAVVTGLHLTPWLGLYVPAYGPLMEALAAGRTAQEILAMNLPTDRGAHFTLALVNLGLAAIVVGADAVRERPQKRNYQPLQLSV